MTFAAPERAYPDSDAPTRGHRIGSIHRCPDIAELPSSDLTTSRNPIYFNDIARGYPHSSSDYTLALPGVSCGDRQNPLPIGIDR